MLTNNLFFSYFVFFLLFSFFYFFFFFSLELYDPLSLSLSLSFSGILYGVEVVEFGVANQLFEHCDRNRWLRLLMLLPSVTVFHAHIYCVTISLSLSLSLVCQLICFSHVISLLFSLSHSLTRSLSLSLSLTHTHTHTLTHTHAHKHKHARVTLVWCSSVVFEKSRRFLLPMRAYNSRDRRKWGYWSFSWEKAAP